MQRRYLALGVLALLVIVPRAAADDDDEADDLNPPAATADVETAETPKAPAGPYTAPAFTGSANLLETFQDDGWSSRWVRATDDKYATTDDYTVSNANEPEGIANDKGLLFKNKAKHYGLSRALDTPLATSGDVVIQYEVRMQNGHTCGGAYLKLVSQSSADDLAGLKDDTPYSIMFGPDKCGVDSKTHFIFRHKNPKSGKVEEKHLKAPPAPKSDALSHLYTLHISGNDFNIFIDSSSVAKGSLTGDLIDPPVTPPSQIDDPEDKKPADWVDEAKMADPDATKPDDWDEDAPARIEDPDATKPSGWEDDEPQEVPDPAAKPPEDWDEEDDGEWEAPMVANPKCSVGCGEWKRPIIDNPKYKGKWSAPLIDNPKYKGEWKAKQIDNPDFFEDASPFVNGVEAIGAVSIEVWTMDDGMMFDNIVVTNDKAAADAFAAATFTAKAAAQVAEESAVRAREAKKRREAERGSGFAGEINYWVGEATDAVLANPMVSIPTFLALIGGFIYWAMSGGDDEEDYSEPMRQPSQPAASTTTPKPDAVSTSSAKQADASVDSNSPKFQEVKDEDEPDSKEADKPVDGGKTTKQPSSSGKKGKKGRDRP